MGTYRHNLSIFASVVNRMSRHGHNVGSVVRWVMTYKFITLNRWAVGIALQV